LFSIIQANLIVAIAIAVTGLMTYLLQREQHQTLPLLWPAGGIALAAVILRGRGVLPGILIPLWISCMLSGFGIFLSLLLSLGTTASALLGAKLLQKASWNKNLSTTRDLILLLVLGGLLPMLANGFWKALLLILWKMIPAEFGVFNSIGWTYGCANTTGVIILTPMILLATEGRFRWKSSSGVFNGILPVSCCFIAALIAFGIQSGGGLNRTVAVLAYLPFPFLVWTALTRGLPAATTAILAIIVVAVAFTSRGMGPFSSATTLQGLWQYEVYISILTTMGLLLGLGSEALRRVTALREEALSREAELERVKAQLQPHFLFNCLTAIHSLISTDPGAARSGISSLTRLLRNSLDVSRERRIPLEKEMQIIRDTLALQKMRFEEGLTTSIEVPPEAESFPIAPMVIQPLVENAVKHGVSEGKGNIRIAASVSGDWLDVTVTNTAPPDVDPSSWKPGVGMASLKVRLLDTWGDRAKLSFAASPGGTVTAALRIPRD
jgi:signal transduction histidine kinase